MRVVPSHEKKQRGCAYCAESGRVRDASVWRIGCPHNACPYKVLDNYKTYAEFMESEDSKILVEHFFDIAAGCYTNVASSCVPKRVLSDGDWRCNL